ncbi:MAG TPA: hypothetical protein VGE01_09055 [Fimbriimonas sp.]
MRLSRLALLSATAAFAATASAQVPLPKVRASIGYGTSAEFTGDGGDKVRIDGIQFGADIPVHAILGFQFALSPSILLGGGIGGDDGDVYRLLFTVRRDIPLTSIFVKGGLGWSSAVDRGAGFSDTNGFVASVGVGFPILGALGPLSPSLEVTGYLSDKGSLSGLFIGASVGF